MDKLKPCPFCGDVVVLVNNSEEKYCYLDHSPDKETFCLLDFSQITVFKKIASRKQVITLWNKRIQSI